MSTKLEPDTETTATPDETAQDVTTADPTSTATSTAASTPPAAPRRRSLPTFGLSWTQLVATGLAATTATFAASYLGVTGTVIGAALASVLSVVGNAVYGHSLRKTGERVRVVVPAARRTSAHPPVVPPGGGDDRPPVLPSPDRAGTPTPGWRRIALAALGVFVVVMAVVTGVELIAGRPVSDVVRGDSGGGTSFFGHDTVRTTTVPATTPTVYVTVTPKVVYTTPTVTQTAPPTTSTVTPTPTSSGSATHTTTGTPTENPPSSGSSTP